MTHPPTPAVPPLTAAMAPHVANVTSTTRRLMVDVLLALTPVVGSALWFFRADALRVMAISAIVSALTEAGICRLRQRRLSINDGSVLITALLLALSLPPQLPSLAVGLGAFVAVALGKMAFGGLGQNLFNPAMVGRAFLMACFPAAMTHWIEPMSLRSKDIAVDAISAATPLASAKFSHEFIALQPLVTGDVPGSLGETSALAIFVGGLWLLLRRAGDWRLTVGMLLAVTLGAFVEQQARGTAASLGVMKHLCAGGVMLGAFFIVTDPVTTPLSKIGRWCFGLFVGSLTVILRTFSGYPEGVMFAVLLGNAITPLINRGTMPTPVGGKGPSHATVA